MSRRPQPVANPLIPAPSTEAEAPWPLRLNVERYVDASHVTTAHNRTNHSRHVVIQGLKLRRLAEVVNPQKLAAIFEKILDRYIPDRPHALYTVTVKHPGLRKNFVLRERDFKINSGFALVKKLEAVAQSNENFSPDDRMTLELMILEGVADADMTSRGVARSRAPGEAGALVSFVVDNDDGLCLPKAAAVALANGNLNYFRKVYNIKNIGNFPSHLPPFFKDKFLKLLDVQASVTTVKRTSKPEHKERMIRIRDEHQRNAAFTLLRHCKIPTDKLSYNLDDLQKIYENQPPNPEHEGNFPLFSFHVFTPGGALIRSFTDSTQHNNQFPLLFIHCDGHLDYAFDLVHKGLHFCKICKLAYGRNDHRCKGLCSMCQTHIGECEETFPGEKKRCDDCKCLFMNAACMAAHKKTAATSPVEGACLCTRRAYCEKCAKMYHVDSSDPHKCYHHYCDKCECQRPDNHDCAWRKFRDTEIKKIKERNINFKMGLYDFETMAGELDANDVLHPFAGGHVPILARAEVVCNLCENQPETYNCKNCGRERKFKFIYEPGQSKSQVVEDFIMHFAGNKRYDNYLMLAHYASGFDTLPILSHLLSKGIRPNVVHSGTKVLQMTIDKDSFDFEKARKQAKDKSAIKNPVKARLVFKDTLLFTTCALEAFPKAFGIEEQKGFFPFDLISDKYWDYDEDKYPDFKFWKASERYKKEKAEAIRKWYDSVKGTPYNFKEELDKYCRNDVTMLKKGVLKFRQAFIKENDFDPFQECMTAASASQFAFRLKHLKHPEWIAHIDERGAGIRDNQSSLALRYLHWRSEKENIKIQTALSKEGEARINVFGNLHYKVDGYIAASRRIVEVHGCYWHGCPDCNQLVVKEAKRVEMADRLAQTKIRTQRLRDAGYIVEEVWEHEIKSALDTDSEMKKWFSEWEYIERLFPRSAYFGGRTFTSKMIEKCGPLEEIKFYDVNSLYPAMMFKRRYPIGKPKVLKLIRDDFKYDVNPLKYRGLIQCTVVVPPDQRFAVLPSRHNGQLYFGNCRSCCETEQQICTHTTDKERAFSGVWTHVELREAVKYGAVIGETVEIWHWDKWSKRGQLFGSFVSKFYRTKIANSGWDSSLKTLKMKRKFLRDLKKKMGIQLTFSDMKENPTLRQLAKIQLNSMYGKFGERCVRTCTEYHTERGEIERLLRDPSIEIKACEWIPSSLDVVGDEDSKAIWMFVFQTAKESKHSVRFGNIGLASFITAYARLEILKHIRTAGSAHVYTDTDSVAFKVKEGDGVMDKFKKSINLHLGGLSDEVKEGWKIVRWVAPSAKCYGYEMVKRDDPSQKKYVMKIRGVCMTEDNQTGYSFEHFLKDVEDYVKEFGEEQERLESLYNQQCNEAIENGEPLEEIARENPLPFGKVVHNFRNEQIRRKRHALVTECVAKKFKIHQHKGVLDCQTGTVYPLGYKPQ